MAYVKSQQKRHFVGAVIVQVLHTPYLGSCTFTPRVSQNLENGDVAVSCRSEDLISVVQTAIVITRYRHWRKVVVHCLGCALGVVKPALVLRTVDVGHVARIEVSKVVDSCNAPMYTSEDLCISWVSLLSPV